MNFQKHQRLINSLIAKTERGKLDWKPSSVGTEAFEVSFAGSGLRIREDPGRSGNDVAVDLVNANGDIVETFTDEDLGDGWYSIMYSLFEMARRVAMGSDKVLNDILLELDDEIPF